MWSLRFCLLPRLFPDVDLPHACRVQEILMSKVEMSMMIRVRINSKTTKTKNLDLDGDEFKHRASVK